MSSRALLLVALASLLGSQLSFAQETQDQREIPPNHRNFSGLGIGVTGDRQQMGLFKGQSLGLEANVSTSSFWQEMGVLSRLAARAHYNVMSNSNLDDGGMGSTVALHARTGVGMDLDNLEKGVSLFLSAGASGGYSGYFNQKFGSAGYFVIGPETGLRVIRSSYTLLATPSVGYGTTTIKSGDKGGATYTSDDRWAFGGRVNLSSSAVDFYGEYFTLAKNTRAEFKQEGGVGNAELSVKISNRLSILGYWEFVRAASDLGYAVKDKYGTPVQVPNGYLDKASQHRFGVSGRYRFQK